MSNLEIVHLINQLFSISWYQLKPNIRQYLIPFVYNLLDDMIPFNGLHEIYTETITTICPLTNANSHQHLSESNIIIKSILYELKWMSVTITVGSLYKQTKTTLNLTRSFDNLFVGTVNNYLIDPEEINYFNIILRNLKSIPHNEEHQHQYLIYLYENINNLFQEYHINYLLVQEQLKIIEKNKIILKPFDQLVNIGLNILDRIKSMSNLEIVHLINQLFSISWYQLKPNIRQYLIPFVYNLLDDMIPFNGLHEIYTETITTICPLTNANSYQHLSESNIIIKSILYELKWMSVTITVGCICLLLLSLISSFLL
ncbi:unnamed protein product [Schistosoma turkestanicum]|nr:unnamed protein product [Schistosoma turkestanicum]